MLTFDVYRKNTKIDTVFYDDDIVNGFKNLYELKDYIKKGLVEHDGYNSDIWLLCSKI